MGIIGKKRTPNAGAQGAITESSGVQKTRRVIEILLDPKPPGQGKLPRATARSAFFRTVQQRLAQRMLARKRR